MHASPPAAATQMLCIEAAAVPPAGSVHWATNMVVVLVAHPVQSVTHLVYIVIWSGLQSVDGGAGGGGAGGTTGGAEVSALTHW